MNRSLGPTAFALPLQAPSAWQQIRSRYSSPGHPDGHSGGTVFFLFARTRFVGWKPLRTNGSTGMVTTSRAEKPPDYHYKSRWNDMTRRPDEQDRPDERLCPACVQTVIQPSERSGMRSPSERPGWSTACTGHSYRCGSSRPMPSQPGPCCLLGR